MHVVDSYHIQVRSPTRVSYISKGGYEKVQIVSEDTNNEFHFIFLDDVTDWTQLCKENSLIFKGKNLILFDRFSTLEKLSNNQSDIYSEINLYLKDNIVYFFRHKEEKNTFMLVNQDNVNKILGEL